MTDNGGVSWWWKQQGLPVPRPSLDGDIDVDVAIVGGGYTGLWAAYYLKTLQPDLRVAIIEARFAGFGASGRNGGWLANTVTGGKERYERSHGREAAIAQQRALNDAVDEVIRFAARERIDADVVKSGELVVAYTPAQHARLERAWQAEASWPATDAPESLQGNTRENDTRGGQLAELNARVDRLPYAGARETAFVVMVEPPGAVTPRDSPVRKSMAATGEVGSVPWEPAALSMTARSPTASPEWSFSAPVDRAGMSPAAVEKTESMKPIA